MSQNTQSMSSEDTRGNRLTASGRDIPYSETRIVPLVQQALKLTIGILTGLLLMRFLFALFGITRMTGLVSTVLSTTDPLVAPFRNVFGSMSANNTATFETEALLAAIVICLGGTFIIWLLNILDKSSK